VNVKLKIDNVKLWSRFTVALILHFSLYTFHSAIAASRPFAWTAETSRPERMRFEAYHGDAMSFEVAFNALGKPLNIESAGYAATMYWQTNGMETAFWELPCSISGSVARTSFPSSLDPGAKQLHFMLAVSSESNLVYAAEAYVKMLSSPGFAPNAIEMPIRMIDFATIAVTNAPWATEQDIELASAALRGEIAAKADAEIVTIEDSYWLHIGYGYTNRFDHVYGDRWECRNEYGYTESLEWGAPGASEEGEWRSLIWNFFDVILTTTEPIETITNVVWGSHTFTFHAARPVTNRVVYTDTLAASTNAMQGVIDNLPAPDFTTNNTALAETIEATIPGNVYWATTDGGRTLKAYPRVNGSTNTASSATFQRGNVWLEYDNGKISAYTDEEVSND